MSALHNDILVSIYCLAYNHDKYIRDCLDGFINQKTNFKYEVIVHDDASTDFTAKIIQEYADRYPNVIIPILQKENRYSKIGVRLIDQYVLPVCRGKYVAVCEGDDYWCDDNKLQKQVNVLENNPEYVACVHQTKILDCRNGKESLISPYNEDCIVEVEKVLSRGGAVFQTSSLMYRKELDERRPDFCFVTRQVADYPFAIYLALSGSIYFLNDVMSVYRMYTEGSWTVYNASKPNIEHRKDMIKMWMLADKYSDFKYHKLWKNEILNFEYYIWKHTKEFSILGNKHFWLLPFSKKIKLFFRILLKV